jgi:hypothetical protein
MKKIVLLCGADRSGKTNTIKSFFGVTGRLKRNQLLRKIVNSKIVYAVSASAPQELEKFCHVDDVKNRIQKRIDKCEEISSKTDYVLILPFGIYAKKGEKKINAQCLLEPLRWLRGKGFEVTPVYLRKEKTALLELKDTLIRSIAEFEIKSDMDYDRQAKELREIIKDL